MNDIGDGSPLADIGTLERDELRCLIENFPLPYDELMERVNIHELVVRSSCIYLCSFFADDRARQLRRESRFL